MTLPKDTQFFLGSNTKRGFVPLFNELRDPVNGSRLYILKGGPGSGKSSLMRRIAKALAEAGHYVEYIPCASDPDSLDAIIDYDAKTSVVDGTAPHTMDPDYPGAYDLIVNVGEAWDQNSLNKNKLRIIELCKAISHCHRLATSCITSASALLDSNKTLAAGYIDHNAIDVYVQKISEELKSSVTGRERKRLLSAVSVGKTVFFDETMTSLCPRLYVIEDEWGAASELLLSKLHDIAAAGNIEMITCPDSINPDKIDHLLFPSAKLGITNSNSFHSTSCRDTVLVTGLMEPANNYELEAMTDNLAAARHLIDAAANHVEHAKELHDELEKFYISAMDFSKIDLVYDRLVNEILNDNS